MKTHVQEILSQKGRYIFIPLDQLHGKESDPILSGARDQDIWPGGVVNINCRLGDPKIVPDDQKISLSTILWSDKQKELLDNDPSKMITCSDFGTGKFIIH